MTDGRKHRPAHRADRTSLSPRVPHDPPRHLARPAAAGGSGRRLAVPTVAALALGLTGAGVVVAAPAGAADLDAQVDRAQARVDRLDAAAEAQQRRLDQARDRAGASQARLERLDAELRAQRERADSLSARVAQSVLVEQDAAPAAAAPMSETSEQLLVGLATVTEDTGDTASGLVDAEAAQQRLTERRDTVRAELRERRQAARQASAGAERAGAELGAAQGRLSELQEKVAAEASRSAVDFALAQVGKSYVWGAAGPDAFDCSGLTMAAWATEGVALPHNSQAQYAAGTPVSESELQPGDLVFYYSPISHVGIYVGDGQIVNALNPGSGVQVSGLHDMPYSGAVRPG